MKLSKEAVMVAKGMSERGTSGRRLAGQLGGGRRERCATGSGG